MDIKENSGLIFRNEKKSDAAPDYRGEINVNGEKFDIALWVKDGKEGKKFFAVKISEPYKKAEKQEATPEPDEVENNDDLPF